MAPPYGPFVVVAENIRSLHNVGAIFRTADGAGVSWIFLGGYSGRPPRPEISKVALGADEWLPWQHVWEVPPLLDELAGHGYQILALERTAGAIPLHQFQPRWPLALIIGNEVEGLGDAVLRRAHHLVSIPMRGRKESLNVSVAFGIAAFRLAEALPENP